MEYSTKANNFYAGTEVPLAVGEGMYREENIDDRFRIVFISIGSGIIETSAGSSPFIAPTLCCLNETETVKIQTSQKYETIELVYHPQFLIPSYDNQPIRLGPQAFMENAPYEGALLNAFTKRSSNFKGIININAGISLQIETILRKINKELKEQRDCYWPYRTRSSLLELLLMIDRMYVKPINNETIVIAEKYRNINEIIIYLMNNCQEKIQLRQLTERFNINRTSLNEYFKAATGCTVMSYFMQLRIHLAMAMLKDTTLKVPEIMFRAGFVNTSHFLRSFKKITGLSPMKYREIHTHSNK